MFWNTVGVALGQLKYYLLTVNMKCFEIGIITAEEFEKKN